MTILEGAVEGPVDEAAWNRIVTFLGGEVGRVFVCDGKPNLRKKLPHYNMAAKHSSWFCIADLDYHEYGCAVQMINDWKINFEEKMCFRIAVGAVESWLLADSENLSRFLDISEARITDEPDSIFNPKQYLVNIARHSKSREVRDRIVPRQDSGAQVGPGYTASIQSFILKEWSIKAAMTKSPSLRRCINKLSSLV